ncbi:MAG: hypothetical protein IKT33_01665 [Clostridia bacterium]|nr:hypothetical protein [Clostridia bacterium]
MNRFFVENKNHTTDVVYERFDYYIDDDSGKCYEEYHSFMENTFYKRRISFKEYLYLTKYAERE